MIPVLITVSSETLVFLLTTREPNVKVMGEVENNLFTRFMHSVFYAIDAPVTFFKEKIVAPNQQKYPWYHQQFRRVPTADQCYEDDVCCLYEADCQYHRDRLVDSQIVCILRHRYEECTVVEGEIALCEHLLEDLNKASTAHFIKYGDMGHKNNARDAYMKQKHRMVWERRHGPVGSGMNEKYEKL